MKVEKKSDSRRHIIVTGASRGLGLSIVEKLLESDLYDVSAVSRSGSSQLEQLRETWCERCETLQYDCSKSDELVALHKRVASVSQFNPPYALVNNAARGTDGILATLHEKDITDCIETNLLGPILLTKLVARTMIKHKRGVILNIASIIGTTGFSGLSVYGASKAGLIGFSKSLSRELGKANIRVNSVSPGYMTTSMTEGIKEHHLDSIIRRSPFNKLASAGEVAELCVWLISDAAAAITGQDYIIDYGSTV